MTSSSMIVVEGITKFYGARQALADLSFEIEEGSVVGFLGLNGAGKTTVLKILSGLLLPSAGRFFIDGKDGLREPRELRRRIGFLPDRPPLYDDMTVTQGLAYAGQLNGLQKDEVGRRVDQVIEACDLGAVRHDLIAWLSHGYRQRVGIAQAIVHRPKLLLLDEPISGLDPVQIVGMRGLIRQLATEHTVLLSSHILGEISQTCDRILVLDQGRIVARGTEEELAEEMRSSRIEVVGRGDVDKTRAVAGRVEGVTVQAVEELPAGGLRLVAEAPTDEAREELVSALCGEGLRVRRVAEVESGLESIFLRLTGRAPGAAAAEPPATSTKGPAEAAGVAP